MTDDHPRPTLPVLAAVRLGAGGSAAVPALADLVPVDDARLVASAGPEVGGAGELVAHVLGELPALAVLEDRERGGAAAGGP